MYVASHSWIHLIDGQAFNPWMEGSMSVMPHVLEFSYRVARVFLEYVLGAVIALAGWNCLVSIFV